MKVQIINEAMTEEHLDNLSKDIEVLILINYNSKVKIHNLPFGLKYLIFSLDVYLNLNCIPVHIKLPFGCESLLTLHEENFIYSGHLHPVCFM